MSDPGPANAPIDNTATVDAETALEFTGKMAVAGVNAGVAKTVVKAGIEAFRNQTPENSSNPETEGSTENPLDGTEYTDEVRIRDR